MKRFYKQAGLVAGDDGYAIQLDSRAVKTPARAPLLVPGAALAAGIVEEWNGQGDKIDPRTMPLTGLANAAIDRVAPDEDRFAADLAQYGETDLLCYRADDPPELVERQQAIWDPLLGWARARYDIAFELATGIVHKAQPPATIARLSEAVRARSTFELAALSPIVTISGSLIIALALLERELTPDAAFDAGHLDELWQAEIWGEEYFAQQARDARRKDFLAAARFLALVGEG